MAKALITWPNGSTDGAREGKKLQAIHSGVSEWVEGSGLDKATKGAFQTLIVVGHRSEIASLTTLSGLIGCIKAIGVKAVVMANCNSSTTKSEGALSDFNELWSPAQRIANETGVPVVATTRVLLFDEVGKSEKFAAHKDWGVGPADVEGGTLWTLVKKQKPIDELITGFSGM